MSYESEIRSRVIFNNWSSYERIVGKLRMVGIIDVNVNSPAYTNRIGSEVRFKYSEADWILRTYVDGTAYFYPDKLNVFNYNTRESIKNLIYKHYRIVREVQETIPTRMTETMLVLRRIAVGELSNVFFNKAQTFSDYLTQKYNMGERSADA